MSLEHLVISEHKEMLKGMRGEKVGGCQKGMRADLKAGNGQNWNNFRKNINNDGTKF